MGPGRSAPLGSSLRMGQRNEAPGLHQPGLCHVFNTFLPHRTGVLTPRSAPRSQPPSPKPLPAPMGMEEWSSPIPLDTDVKFDSSLNW